MNYHPYVARIMPAREVAFQPRALNRKRASQWSVDFLVKSERMLTSSVMYENVMSNRRIYFNRISDAEFDMLQAFDVKFVSHHAFLANWTGISYWYINDDGSTVWVDVINRGIRPYGHME